MEHLGVPPLDLCLTTTMSDNGGRRQGKKGVINLTQIHQPQSVAHEPREPQEPRGLTQMSAWR